MKKTCKKCATEKSLDCFSRAAKSPDGLQYWCKDCMRINEVARYRANPERKRELARERYRADRKRGARYYLGRRVQREFGLTLEEYDALVAQPCGLCGRTEDIVLDHCHETNVVRGPLCQVCNKAIGMLGDDPARLRAAADYIELHREQEGAEWTRSSRSKNSATV